jgi:hypothetical protein
MRLGRQRRSSLSSVGPENRTIIETSYDRRISTRPTKLCSKGICQTYRMANKLSPSPVYRAYSQDEVPDNKGNIALTMDRVVRNGVAIHIDDHCRIVVVAQL